MCKDSFENVSQEDEEEEEEVEILVNFSSWLFWQKKKNISYSLKELLRLADLKKTTKPSTNINSLQRNNSELHNKCIYYLNKISYENFAFLNEGCFFMLQNNYGFKF